MAVFVPNSGHKRSKNQSGRPDLNRRPLDPQEVGFGVCPGQSCYAGGALGVPTCGLFSRVHTVWSQSGPNPCRERAAQRPPRCELVARRSLTVAGAGHRSTDSSNGRIRAAWLLHRLLHMPTSELPLFSHGVRRVASDYASVVRCRHRSMPTVGCRRCCEPLPSELGPVNQDVSAARTAQAKTRPAMTTGCTSSRKWASTRGVHGFCIRASVSRASGPADLADSDNG